MKEQQEIERLLIEFLTGKCNVEFLDSNSAENLKLLTDGILDSIGVIKLVGFIEEKFNAELLPEDIHPDIMNTIPQIVMLITKR